MTTPTSTLTCPKCQGAMRSYDRGGVVVDQCEECRGIFLDRGELDILIDAENTFNDRRYSAGPGAVPMPGYGPAGGYHGSGHHGSSHQGRRRGFLGGLFD